MSDVVKRNFSNDGLRVEFVIRTEKPRFSDFGDDINGWRQACERYNAYNQIRWTYAFIGLLVGVFLGGLSSGLG